MLFFKKKQQDNEKTKLVYPQQDDVNLQKTKYNNDVQLNKQSQLVHHNDNIYQKKYAVHQQSQLFQDKAFLSEAAKIFQMKIFKNYDQKNQNISTNLNEVSQLKTQVPLKLQESKEQMQILDFEQQKHIEQNYEKTSGQGFQQQKSHNIPVETNEQTKTQSHEPGTNNTINTQNQIKQTINANPLRPPVIPEKTNHSQVRLNNFQQLDIPLTQYIQAQSKKFMHLRQNESQQRISSQKKNQKSNSMKEDQSKNNQNKVDEQEQDQDYDNRCPVCYTQLTNPHQSNVCKHKLCLECWEKWLERQLTCPLCKARVRRTFLEPSK